MHASLTKDTKKLVFIFLCGVKKYTNTVSIYILVWRLQNTLIRLVFKFQCDVNKKNSLIRLVVTLQCGVNKLY